jgi:hypothetical protein
VRSLQVVNVRPELTFGGTAGGYELSRDGHFARVLAISLNPVGRSREKDLAQRSVLIPLGYYPISVQGGGSGADIRFVVVFARQESVLSRQWNVTGVGTAAPVDAVMHDMLTASGIRNASLAVVDNTRLVFAKAYTWAEPGYPVALPTTLFRQASVSKIFAAVAAYQLIEEGRMQLTDTVQSILGLTTPTGAPPDPTFAATTVQDLLLHTSRLQPGFAELDLAIAAAFGGSLPITEAQLASYKCGEMPLATAPDYNNWGYALLGMVIARVRGVASFFEAIRRSILEPLQMTRTRLATSLVSTTFADEARYHRSGEGALMLGISRQSLRRLRDVSVPLSERSPPGRGSGRSKLQFVWPWC